MKTLTECGSGSLLENYKDFMLRLGRFTRTRLGRICPEMLMLRAKESLNIVQRLDYERRNILLNVGSDIELFTRLHSCEKEPEVVRWIENMLKPGDILFDIGANVGVFSLIAAKYHNDQIKAYSFEPSFLNFPSLCRNIVINCCQESIVPLHIALSDRTGMDCFNYNNLTAGGAMHALGSAIDFKGDVFQPVFRQQVPCYRLDDFRSQHGIPAPNHLKMDVDGIEYKILAGAEKTLSDLNVRSIMIEIEESREESKMISALLKSKGFSVHSKYKYTRDDDSGPYSNIFNYIFHRE